MILDEIAEKTRERVKNCKEKVSLEEMKKRALALVAEETNNGKEPYEELAFEKALEQPGISFICEVKKASPSKGVIAQEFPYLQIAKEYEEAGAAAISVLTEPFYFQGSNDYLAEIARNVSIPVLRKDFVVDAYMIYEAKLLGASAVLLICAILNDDELTGYLKLAKSLGMSALVEAHDREELGRAIRAKADIIGVNNRDLKTFEVDIMNSIRLRSHVPDFVDRVDEKGRIYKKRMIYVSESGIRTAEDVKRLAANRTNAVLIGETFMRSPHKKEVFEELMGKK